VKGVRSQALLFDLDGTLVDTAPDLTTAANAVRRSNGLPALTVERVAGFVGKGAEVLIRRVLTDDPDCSPDADRLAKAMKVFEAAYARCNGELSQLYPGVLQGLRRLRDAALPMAVVTNKPQSFSEALLERMELTTFFRFVQGGDVVAHKKPHPEPLWHAIGRLGSTPAKACMLGDSHNDALAARAAGVRILLVPYGYNEGRDPRNEDCDGLVNDVDAFAQWMLEH
jgi:phosphoglycolate phosphatase